MPVSDRFIPIVASSHGVCRASVVFSFAHFHFRLIIRWPNVPTNWPILRCCRCERRVVVLHRPQAAKTSSMSHCTISRRTSFSEPTRLRSVCRAILRLVHTSSQIVFNNSNRCFLPVSIVGRRPYAHLYHAIHYRMPETTAKVHKQITRTTGDVFVGHFAF